MLLTTEQFIARYQADPATWFAGAWWPNRGDGSMRYAADMWDLSREASLVLKLNIDFQVQPPYESDQFAGKPWVRLDDVAEIADNAPKFAVSTEDQSVTLAL